MTARLNLDIQDQQVARAPDDRPAAHRDRVGADAGVKASAPVVAPASGIAVLGCALALLGVLEAFLLYRSFHFGELVRAIPWDDCSILDLALLRLQRAASASSIAGIFAQAQDLAPHSPVADIQSMVGYLLSGGRVWGPYLLNAAPLAAGLALAWPALRRYPPIVCSGILLAILCNPITYYSLTILKSDWKSGFFIALATLCYARALEDDDRRLWTAGSALLGISILCKLTAFYLPVLALLFFALLWAAHIVRRVGVAAGASAFRPGPMIGQTASEWRTAAVCLACIVGPFALFFFYASHSHFNIIRYIRQALSDTWTDGLTYPQRAAAYLPPENPTWGPIAWLVGLGFVACLSLAVRRREARFVELLVLAPPALALFIAPIVFAKTSNIEFGGTFVGLGLGFALAMLARASTLSRRSRYLMLAAAIVCAVFSSFKSYFPPVDAQQEKDQVYAVGVYHDIVDTLIRYRKTDNLSLDLYYQDSLVPHPNMSLMYFDETGSRLDINRIDKREDVAPSQAEFTLVAEPTAPAGIVGYIPSMNFWTATHPRLTAAIVAGFPHLKPVRSYPWKNGRITLYRDERFTRPTPTDATRGAEEPAVLTQH
jgi:hypothetical protein